MGRVATFSAGDVVVADFPGVTGVKRRPAVVLSGERYRDERPDVIVGLVTTNVTVATTAFDTRISDLEAAGLHHASAFRCFLVALPRAQVLARIGHLADEDWRAVVACVRRALPQVLG